MLSEYEAPITFIAAGTDLTLEWCDDLSAASLRFSTATGRRDCVCFRALIRFSLSPCVRTALFPFSSEGDCRADPGGLPLKNNDSFKTQV